MGSITTEVKRFFSLPCVVPCFPLLGLTPSGLFMGLSSTIIYTSELKGLGHAILGNFSTDQMVIELTKI